MKHALLLIVSWCFSCASWSSCCIYEMLPPLTWILQSLSQCLSCSSWSFCYNFWSLLWCSLCLSCLLVVTMTHPPSCLGFDPQFHVCHGPLCCILWYFSWCLS
jgi:hypothetical protein